MIFDEVKAADCGTKLSILHACSGHDNGAKGDALQIISLDSGGKYC